jgi:hypothetical protein
MYSRVHILTLVPSIEISIGAPQTDITAGARNRISGPFNVISRPSVPTGLPVKIFATANKGFCQHISLHLKVYNT